MRRTLRHFRKSVFLALEHDVLNTAKAAAYSGMLMFFPAFIVLTALIAKAPEGPTVVGEIRWVSMQILPADTVRLMLSTMQARNAHPARLITSGLSLSVFAGLGLMLTLMEGFRRAYRLPRNEWGFWERRLRALFLVFIVLVPLALATLLLVFGRAIELWMVVKSGHELRHVVLFLWRMARWTLALATSLAVLGALYHFGTKRGEHWLRVMPGAVAASAVWFPATLAFGWYVTRIADYTIFYGSFGAGIATLVWLYITSFSALLGAELNGVLFRERNNRL
ncbi:YihY/virulence factor BrkB family protein [Telmatobacter sp. DSM 110680]|uniref:YihY/virulence factor BrkB family protein n=1 Tax=Telmatobacter sp. DSM 110680 TaxID=3036704 RepID=A0AAU7DPV2_9BACT